MVQKSYLSCVCFNYRRDPSELAKFRPAQPTQSQEFEFPQMVPILQKPVDKVSVTLVCIAPLRAGRGECDTSLHRPFKGRTMWVWHQSVLAL